MNPRVDSLILAVGPVGSWSTCGAGLGGLFQEGPCGVRIAHRGLLVEAEDLGKVEWVRAVNHGLFKLSVDAEPLQGGVLSAHRRADPVVAGPAGGVGGLVC